MNASRNFGVALLLGMIGAIIGALLVTLLAVFVLPGGLGGGDGLAGGAAQSAPAHQTQVDPGQDVSQEEASEIAVAHLGGGEVTWTSREDDYGAAWEIEVTGSDGSESNVYVASDGQVTHVE